MMPYLRCLFAGHSPRQFAFDPRPVHVGFSVQKVGLLEIFLRVSPHFYMKYNDNYLEIKILKRRNYKFHTHKCELLQNMFHLHCNVT